MEGGGAILTGVTGLFLTSLTFFIWNCEIETFFRGPSFITLYFYSSLSRLAEHFLLKGVIILKTSFYILHKMFDNITRNNFTMVF